MTIESPPFRVRYAETDAQGVAYYGAYFTWHEVGEIHWLESQGLPLPQLQQRGLILAVAESFTRFLRPAGYDEQLVARTRLAAAAPKRILFENQIVRVADGQTLAVGRLADVVLGPWGEVASVPPELLAAAEERVEQVVVGERAEELLAPTPRGAPQCTHDIKVRYAETDAQGVAYYGSHYEWFEAGRNELTRSLGLPYSELEARGTLLPVAEAYCRYLAPLGPCETFRMTTAVPRLTRARITFTNRMASVDGRRPIAAGYTVHGCTGRDGRPHGLPPEIVERFAPRPDGQ
ncbi:MAG: acyl-CoA thioesterase [Candidatus Brocadiia bacterium]